ncbi:hypothetical protein GCM10023086_16410 [Streptomyces venetus]|uniref:Secreted protein n=1 Tax=Streptomyces venetus TaxID=1701086 RepID=A0ABP8FCX2_9ACTN
MSDSPGRVGGGCAGGWGLLWGWVAPSAPSRPESGGCRPRAPAFGLDGLVLKRRTGWVGVGWVFVVGRPASAWGPRPQASDAPVRSGGLRPQASDGLGGAEVGVWAAYRGRCLGGVRAL